MGVRRSSTGIVMTALVILFLFHNFSFAEDQIEKVTGQLRDLGPSKAVPSQLNYQGDLADAADSSAVTATLEMTFRLFDSETKGAELWAETHSAVEVNSGLFQVLLGSTAPFPDGLFNGTELWLQTEVGPEVLAPRKPLVSVAYSHRTNSAEMLLDNTLTDLDDRWVNEEALDHLDAADGDPASAVHVDDAGKVGIGTASPLTELDVNGSINATTYYGDGSHLTGISGTADSDWTVAGDDMYSAVTGYIGIGTTTPSYPLEVNGPVSAATYYGDGSNLTGISGTTDNDWTISGNDIYSAVSGNVGVGTSSPSARLDVSGVVNTDSLYKIDGNTVLSAEGSKNIFVGPDAGANSTGIQCTFVGYRTGPKNQNNFNTFIGASAGDSNTTGYSNTFVGTDAGVSNTIAHGNTFVGVLAGAGNTTGTENTFAGHMAGQHSSAGNRNTFVGASAGNYSPSAFSNVYIGWQAGYMNGAGSYNVFIGPSAGYDEEGSNKLIIANGMDTSDVLIYGDFSTGDIGLGTMDPAERLHLHKTSGHLGMRISSDAASYQYLNFGADKGYGFGRDPNNKFFLNAEQPLGVGTVRILTATETGNVGIGTASPGYKLDVAGDINTTGEIRRNGSVYNHPDYVFEPDYELISITELKAYVAENRHLPGMPSAEEVREDGVKLFEQNRLVVEKLEEAYLYILELEERIAQLEDSQK